MIVMSSLEAEAVLSEPPAEPPPPQETRLALKMAKQKPVRILFLIVRIFDFI